VEQERVQLLARLKELTAQRDSVFLPTHATHPLQPQLTRIQFSNSQENLSSLSLDEFALGGEHPTSPLSSSASKKIGSVSGDKPSTRHRQLEAVFIPHLQRAPAPWKSTGKPPVGGMKTQTKTAANPTRPVKVKGAPRQKPMQNPEGTATKGPTQRVIHRVYAVVEVPIKVEDEEDELGHTLVEDRKGRVPSDMDPRPSTSATKVSKPGETSRTKRKTLAAYRDEDVTPPAPAPIVKRRKSGVDPDYYEPDKEADCRRGQEDSAVKHRSPSRRKSIREPSESDFEYDEEEEDNTDADELNLRVSFPFPRDPCVCRYKIASESCLRGKGMEMRVPPVFTADRYIVVPDKYKEMIPDESLVAVHGEMKTFCLASSILTFLRSPVQHRH
jgi:hypothetical protein